MVNKKYLYGGILTSILFLAFLGTITLSTPIGAEGNVISVIDDLGSAKISEGGWIRGHVDILVNRWDDERGEYEGPVLWDSSSNLVYDDGLDMVKEILGADTALEPITTIALCNATGGASDGCDTPVAAQTGAFQEYTTDGLASATGTYASLGTGNWSVYNTFTAGAAAVNFEINATKLRGGVGRNLSGNTFTLVTLQANDQITVNWTVTVERAA